MKWAAVLALSIWAGLLVLAVTIVGNVIVRL